MALDHADRTVEHYTDLLAQSKVPTHLHAGLVRYFVGHVKPGSFLLAVLSGNLSDAERRGEWKLEGRPDRHLARLCHASRRQGPPSGRLPGLCL